MLFLFTFCYHIRLNFNTFFITWIISVVLGYHLFYNNSIFTLEYIIQNKYSSSKRQLLHRTNYASHNAITIHRLWNSAVSDISVPILQLCAQHLWRFLKKLKCVLRIHLFKVAFVKIWFYYYYLLHDVRLKLMSEYRICHTWTYDGPTDIINNIGCKVY